MSHGCRTGTQCRPATRSSGALTMFGPTVSTTVRHTCVLSRGTTNVVDTENESPPFGTVSGGVDMIVPSWSVMIRRNWPDADDATE